MMNFKTKLFTGFLIGMLSACGSSPRVTSSFADVDANGEVDSPFSGSEQYTITRIEDGSGYSIQVFGSRADFTSGVYVGRVDTSTTGATVRDGSATYEGNWDAIAIKDVYNPRDRQEFGDTGTIILNADFDGAKLTGQATGVGSGETLIIDGDLDGRNVTGTATYAGMEADIDGRIGNQRTYGVFQGNDGDSFLGGGWLATPQASPQ